MGITIAGTGSYTPDKVLTNFDLEKIVDTSDEWIRTRTGISERRIASDDTATSDLAAEAAKRALDAAGISADQLDLLTVASISHDKVFPSTACIVQQKIGASNAACFDIQAACSGLLYSLEVGYSLLKANSKYQYHLIIGAEKLSSIVDWEDRNTCVLFGDGAAAVLLKKDDSKEDCIIASKLGANGEYANILHLPAGGSAMPASHKTIDDKMHCLKMGGQEVFKLAVNSMTGACKDIMKELEIGPEEIKWLVPHQANFRILKAVAQRLKIPVDNVYMNVASYGNTSAASIGICLDEIFRKDMIKEGDYVLLTAFGGGLTWGAMMLRL